MKKFLLLGILQVLVLQFAFAKGSSFVDLGDRVVWQTAEFQVELSNSGEDDLNFDALWEIGLPSLRILDDFPLTLSPGETTYLRMSFVPENVGEFKGEIGFDNGFRVYIEGRILDFEQKVSIILLGKKSFGYVGEELTFEVEVENTGDIAIESFTIREEHTGYDGDIGPIEPGKKLSL
ncbi:hypothetical protein KIH41_02295 [Litoribacter ruber]|uniref:COG1470 family protein n=1 Tax=Litoribacter ruber TaxID=702568 RepID=UPI001BDA3301|nr:hypothetical protein [Litoribacter ruber]MBT0810110.1 hypothetical protein [Litoribacter ruber]